MYPPKLSLEKFEFPLVGPVSREQSHKTASEIGLRFKAITITDTQRDGYSEIP